MLRNGKWSSRRRTKRKKIKRGGKRKNKNKKKKKKKKSYLANPSLGRSITPQVPCLYLADTGPIIPPPFFKVGGHGGGCGGGTLAVRVRMALRERKQCICRFLAAGDDDEGVRVAKL